MKKNPSIPHIELLIFDLDGTLIDSSLDLILSVNATLRHLGRRELDALTIQSYIGRGAPDLIQRATGGNASEEEISAGLDYFIRYYAEHKLDNTALYPGVRETLQALNDPLTAENGNGHLKRTLAVLTNKPERASRSILQELELLHIIPHVIGGNTLPAKKPDPLGIHTLLDAVGVAAQAAMIVGDSDVDVQAGQNAGIWTCGVTYGIGTIDLDANHPDLLIDDLGELIPALAQ